MPEAVELDAPHAGGLDQRRELSLAEVVHLQRVAEHLALTLQVRVLLREHQIEIAVGRPIRHQQSWSARTLDHDPAQSSRTRRSAPRATERVSARGHESKLLTVC